MSFSGKKRFDFNRTTMRKVFQNRVICAVWFYGLLSKATAPPAVTDGARPSFQPFRYDENWSALADESKRADWLDPLKYLSLRRAGWFVTLGGEIRERYELL